MDSSVAPIPHPRRVVLLGFWAVLGHFVAAHPDFGVPNTNERKVIERIEASFGSLLGFVANRTVMHFACSLLLLLASCFLLSCTNESTPTRPDVGTTWRVQPDGSGDAPTIQAAADSAEAGDTIVLAPGTYTWTSEGASGFHMVELKPGISLIGEMGRDATILDGEEQGGVLHCVGSGEFRLEGVTVKRGKTGFGGGGLRADSAMVILKDCSFLANRTLAGGQRGAGVFCMSAVIRQCSFIDNVGGFDTSGAGVAYLKSLDIADCRFENNSVVGDAGSHGTAIHAFSNTEATITRCTFVDNRTRGVFAASGGAIRMGRGVVSKSTFLRNRVEVSTPFVEQQGRGGAIACHGCEVTECVFVGNVATGGGVPGFGGAVAATSVDTVNVRHCTLVGNRAETNGENLSPFLRPIGGIGIFNGRISTTLIVDTVGAAVNSSVETHCINIFNASLGDSLRGMELGGNLSLDPLFCNADPIATLDFSLQADSPCAPGQHPDGVDCGLIGATSAALLLVSTNLLQIVPSHALPRTPSD